MRFVLKTCTGLTKVRHRNEVGQTLSSLSLSAKRVLFLALSQIDTKELLSEEVIEVSAEFYSKATGLDRYAAYSALKEGAKVLSSTALVLNKDDLILLSEELGLPYSSKSKKIPDKIDLNLTEFCAYYDSMGVVKIKFTNTAKRYFSKLIGSERRYTTQVLKSVVNLSSVNSANLYQFIRKHVSMNSKKRSIDVSVNELKDEMGLYEVKEDGKYYKYPKYSFFIRDVINRSMKEINEKTEIKDLSFVVVGKKGRMVDVIRFSFTVKGSEAGFSDEDVKFFRDFDDNCF